MTPPHGLQRLLSWCQWDPDEIRDDLRDYVTDHLGQPDGVLIVDDTGFLKKGTVSAGVQGSIPAPLAARRTARSECSSLMPPRRAVPWWTASSTYPSPGRRTPTGAAPPGFRRASPSRPSRNLPVPWSDGHWTPPGSWRIDHVLTGAPAEAWERISCGDGAKGPRVYDWAAAKLPTIEGSDPAHYRWVLARRSLARPEEIAYYLAFAPADATVSELVRVVGARWAIEECFQAAKNECGLDQYEVRRYVGWYRHITLAMLAHAFLAAMTAQALEKGAAETIRAASFPSPWQKSDGSWTLPIPPQPGTGHPRGGSTGPAGVDTTRPSPAAATTSAARAPIE